MAAHNGLMAPFRNSNNKVRFEHGEPRSRVAKARWIAKRREAAGFFVACELCGGSDWALIGTDDADGIALPLRRDNTPDLWRRFPTQSFECNNCVNGRLMTKVRID